MSDCHYLIFFLLHVPLSLGYRDGAREDSCYDHAITHLTRPGRPPTMKILCEPPNCPYNLTLVGEVMLTDTSERIDNSDEYLRCDSVYMCKFNMCISSEGSVLHYLTPKVNYVVSIAIGNVMRDLNVYICINIETHLVTEQEVYIAAMHSLNDVFGSMYFSWHQFLNHQFISCINTQVHHNKMKESLVN